MPVPAHERFTWLGSFGPPGARAESWSFGLNCGPGPAAMSEATRVNVCNALHERWETAFAGFHLPGLWLEAVKHASIGADGLYTSDAAYSTRPPAEGTADLAVFDRHPPQVALAISLVTNARGAKGRGRFYMPTPAINVDTDWAISQAAAENVRAAAVNLLQFLNDLPEVGNVSVASNSGALFAVTGVRVGQVYDTIRSRRRSMPEDHVASAAVLPR